MITEDFVIGPKLGELVNRMVASYQADTRTQHIDRVNLPSRDEIIRLVQDLLELLYPGFIGRQHLTRHNVAFHVGDVLPRVGETAFHQIFLCLCYMADQQNEPRTQGATGGLPASAGARADLQPEPRARVDQSRDREGAVNQQVGRGNRPDDAPHSTVPLAKGDHRGSSAGHNTEPCDRDARRITLSFLEGIPTIREMLASDVQAAYDGDPAALNCDEVILAYPGLLAISVHRLAHSLYQLGVPLMPRIMSEWAHHHTGIDIHPGARIGHRFFIDHGTGVVIGETTDIGNNVKVYQGVTLGALSFAKDDRGRVIRENKRHPTVQDNVTIYANAIILGGDTVIGEHSVIGGSVFVTSTVPPHSTVTFKPPELRVKTRGADGQAAPAMAPSASAGSPVSAGPPASGRPAPATESTELMPDYMI